LFYKWILVLFFLGVQSSWGSDSFSYSGRLVNADGSPVPGPVNLKAELAYTDDTSDILCSQDLTSVGLTNGVFHIKLDLNCGTKSITQVLSETPATHAVAIRITDTFNNKAYSFQALHSMPYSNVSKQLVQMGATDGQVLTWDDGEWKPLTPPGTSSGSIGTTELADGSVTDPKVANGISRSKLANGTGGYVLVNNGTGVMSETQFLSIAQGGTGATTIPGIFASLGLGSAATADIGLAPGNVLSFNDVDICDPSEKLMMSPGPSSQWVCVLENTSVDSTKLPLAGGTMTGDIVMGNNKITGLGTPVDSDEAVNKAYVDTLSESHWKTNGTHIHSNNTGNVGVGVTTPNEKLDVLGNVALTGGIRLRSGSNYVELRSPSLTGNVLFTLPAVDGSVGQVLKTDGAGNLGWINATAGSITAITATAPLSATTSSGSTTVSVNYDGVTVGKNGSDQLYIPNGGINNAQIGASAAISWTKINKTGSAPSDIGAASELVSITAGTGLLGGGTLEASRILNVNVGTAANQIVQMDATGKLPAIDGSQLTNLPLKWVDAIGGINFPSGNVGIGTNNPESIFHISDEGLGVLSIDNYNSSPGANPALIGRAAGGSKAVPSAIETGKILLFIGGRGYDGSAFTTASRASIAMRASENWTSTAQGSYLTFSTTENLATTTIERMRISDKGNVGIGTTNPNFSLDLSSRNDAIRIPVGTTAERPVSPANGIIRYNNDNNKLEAYVAGMWQDLAAAATGGSYLSSGGGTLSGALTITSGGADITGGINVNSGSITNTGSITGSGALTVAAGGTNQNLTLNSSGTGSVNIGSGNGTAMTVLPNGNVGIGTTIPSSKFQVSDIYTNTTDSTTGLGISIHGSGSDYGGLTLWDRDGNTGTVNDADTTLYWGDDAGESLRFAFKLSGAALSEKMRITSSGNVGVGITTPDHKLDVAGDIEVTNSSTGTRFYSSRSDSDYDIVQSPASTKRTFSLHPSASGGDVFSAFAHNGTGFVPGLLVKNTTGNVGIGTSTPTSKLEVSSAGGETVVLRDNDNLESDGAFSSYIRSKDSAGTNVWYLGDGSSTVGGLWLLNYQAKPIHFATASTTRMTVDETGNVGIGTTSPSRALDISRSDDNTQINIENNSSTADRYPGILINNYYGTGNGLPVLMMGNIGGSSGGPTPTGSERFIGSIIGSGYTGSSWPQAARLDFVTESTFTSTSAPAYIKFSTTSTNQTALSEKMRVTADGNVGIGTSTPKAKLDVNGDLSVSGLGGKLLFYKNFSAYFLNSNATFGTGFSKTFADYRIVVNMTTGNSRILSLPLIPPNTLDPTKKYTIKISARSSCETAECDLLLAIGDDVDYVGGFRLDASNPEWGYLAQGARGSTSTQTMVGVAGGDLSTIPFKTEMILNLSSTETYGEYYVEGGSIAPGMGVSTRVLNVDKGLNLEVYGNDAAEIYRIYGFEVQIFQDSL
jgi:hypothetical protein